MKLPHIFQKFSKKKKYSIDNQMANEMLQNVFAACDREPNTIPFDKLILRRKINTRAYTIGMFLTSLILAITFFLPLAFPPTKATVTSLGGKEEQLKIISHRVEQDLFYLELEDMDISLTDSYMITFDGDVYPAESFDSNTGTLVFPYLNQEVNIYIYDIQGNVLQILLTPKQ